MSPFNAFTTGLGAGKRRTRSTLTFSPITAHALNPRTSGPFPVQSAFTLPTYPFQSLPTPAGPSPYRFDLSQLLSAGDIALIQQTGTMVLHAVGDTGDYRGTQQRFVADMMTADSDNLPDNMKPAFFYHLGDVIYFAGDIDKYGDNFYATYQDYPAFIVAIPGNHDCQPDDPQDGPVDPNKVPLDGWVQNFMAPDPAVQGSMKTGAGRTVLDLPNVYWTFTTPFATILGLFSNVGESEGEIHADQQAWFVSELLAADPTKALIVTVHHPPFSGDTEHSGSSVVDQVLNQSFASANRYPDLVMSGHVHNYQRFTNTMTGPDGASRQVSYVVAGAGGYTNLGKLHKIHKKYPSIPLDLGDGLTLETYNQTDFGFVRLEISAAQITGTYFSAPFSTSDAPTGQPFESFTINLTSHTVTTTPPTSTTVSSC